MRKRRILFITLVVLVLSLAILYRSARADCAVTATIGSDDTVMCTNPPETGIVYTGGGADTITVAQGAEVDSSGTAINAGGGNDTVYNYGSVYAVIDGIDLSSGEDVLHNYGLINAGDDGVGCILIVDRTCTINNYAGRSIVSVNEAVDFYGKAGRAVLNNQGSILPSTEEAVHLFGDTAYGFNTLTVNNSGRIESRRLALEASRSHVAITNSGTFLATRGEPTIRLGGGDDAITNTGSITQTGSESAIVMGAGRDVLTNRGTITAQDDEVIDPAVDMGDSNDTYRHSGVLREMRSGHAAIEMGYGSDTVTIEGGQIQGLILGDDYNGMRTYDRDTLVFQLTGRQSDIDQFQADMAGQSGADGSVTFRGQTYTWRGFEIIQMNLTVDNSLPAPPTPTPLPTNTPTPTPRPTTVAPTPTPNAGNQVCTTSSSAPCLVSPADGATVAAGNVTFTWQPEPDAALYRFAISTTADFSSNVTSIEVTTTSTTLNLGGGTYYWKVRRITSSGGQGTYSSVWRVNVTAGAPTAAPTATRTPSPVGPTPTPMPTSAGPTATPSSGGQVCETSSSAPCLVSPADGVTVKAGNVTFTWQAEPDAATYRFAISTTADFSSGVTTVDVTSTNVTRNLAAGTYYWKVRRITSSGGLGTWSSTWRINVNP